MSASPHHAANSTVTPVLVSNVQPGCGLTNNLAQLPNFAAQQSRTVNAFMAVPSVDSPSSLPAQRKMQALMASSAPALKRPLDQCSSSVVTLATNNITNNCSGTLANSVNSDVMKGGYVKGVVMSNGVAGPSNAGSNPAVNGRPMPVSEEVDGGDHDEVDAEAAQNLLTLSFPR
jgi:hypothetical protein